MGPTLYMFDSRDKPSYSLGPTIWNFISPSFVCIIITLFVKIAEVCSKVGNVITFLLNALLRRYKDHRKTYDQTCSITSKNNFSTNKYIYYIEFFFCYLLFVVVIFTHESQKASFFLFCFFYFLSGNCLHFAFCTKRYFSHIVLT